MPEYNEKKGMALLKKESREEGRRESENQKWKVFLWKRRPGKNIDSQEEKIYHG